MKVFGQRVLKKNTPKGQFFSLFFECLGVFEDIFYRLDVVRSGCQVDFQTFCWVTFSSASPVHSSFAKNTILLNPETFSSLNYKGVWTSDLLKGEEVEVGHLVPWQVEVVANCSVEVVSSRTPVLSAPHTTCPCCPHLADILGWSSQARSCLV